MTTREEVQIVQRGSEAGWPERDGEGRAGDGGEDTFFCNQERRGLRLVCGSQSYKIPECGYFWVVSPLPSNVILCRLYALRLKWLHQLVEGQVRSEPVYFFSYDRCPAGL